MSAAGLLVAGVLSGCTLADRIASGGSSPSGSPVASQGSETTVTPATPAPTVFPFAEGLEGDARACQDANAATDAMFSLAAGGARFDSDEASKAQFTSAVDQLYAARDAAIDEPPVAEAIRGLVFTFTGRASDRDDWLIWDAAKAHAASPDSGTTEDALDKVDDACDDIGYDWVDWEPSA